MVDGIVRQSSIEMGETSPLGLVSMSLFELGSLDRFILVDYRDSRGRRERDC
jgi:hypothetical protein